MEYIIALIFILIGAISNKRLSKDTRRFLLGAIAVYLVLLMGFRYRVGLDTINYMSNYKAMPTLSQILSIDYTKFRYEPGFVFINSLGRFFKTDFWLVQLILAAITNFSITIFLYRYCKNPFVGLLLYAYIAFLYFSAEIIRESAAIGIFLLNYENLKNKRWTRYYLVAILSISLHYSAILTLAMPFLGHLKFNKWYIALCICAIVATPFIQSVNEILNFSSITDRINYYMDGNGLNINFRIGLLLQNVVPASFCLLALKKYKQKPIPFFRSMTLLQFLFVAGSFAIPIIFQRFINYTQIFTVVLMANTLSDGKIKQPVRLLAVLVIMFSQSLYLKHMYRSWIPYVSVFNPVKIEAREQLYKHEF